MARKPASSSPPEPKGNHLETSMMRRLFHEIRARNLLFLIALAATFAYAQTNNIPQVQHVIVVIQENRTPDNLFQQDQTLINNGAHIASQGSCGHGSFNLLPTNLGTCWDTDHSHKYAWTAMWAQGAATGA